ncbi:MAG: hypothetical protein JRG92_10085 [Deltaproteobacteria bacterium]|nr:hypothetical protein [Deltaproteobacteria bacterium]MBW2383975.1 hypothetical protein [Deltaproteobacteria bacterium]MBW2697827.1 hypothetical protein [Deltaproteobacteria bacterium]
MNSFEVLREVVEVVGAKQVAFDLRVSSSLVYKWCSQPGERGEMDATGARNPLDRTIQVCESTRSRRPVEWLCGQMGGYFVENPDAEPEELDAEFLRHTQELVGRFSQLLNVLSTSIGNQSRIDQNESSDIRRQWRELQSHGEAFVRACEQGLFDPER